MSVRTLAALCCAGACLTGCVERRIVVTSEPPGALVWLNDVEIGRTPAETEFLYHGVYDVRLELDGYEPLITSHKADAPWWEYPGPDFIAEISPVRHENVQEWHFVLEPALGVVQNESELEEGLVERANELRNQLEEQSGS